jgi:hypothetical protein
MRIEKERAQGIRAKGIRIKVKSEKGVEIVLSFKCLVLSLD